MTATILDGRVLTKELQGELKEDVAAFAANHGAPPHLAVIQVEGDAASDRYVRVIRKLCGKVGIDFSLEKFAADISQADFNEHVRKLSKDEHIHGILIQVPLPETLSADQAVLHLDYTKDVDGVHPFNTGLLAQGRPLLVPNTPSGGMVLLQRYNIPLEGRHVAVVGYSSIVGRPMAALLVQANATVTICHSFTKDLATILRECDVVVVAVGQENLIRGDMLRPGAVVVDFGINVLPDGRVVGDVDFESAAEVVSAITPVPGGTGPVTNVMLLRNVMTAAQRQIGA